MIPIKKAVFLLSFLMIFNCCFSQEKKVEKEFDIIHASLFYPQTPKLRKIKVAILIEKFKFPEAWLEGAYHIPFLNVQGRMGLHRNFTAHLNLGTVIISNQLAIGVKWNKQFNDTFSFNIGYDLAGVIGALSFADFNTDVRAIIHNPNFSFGYRYKDVAFTIKSELSVVSHVKIRTGENVISDEKNFYNGFSVGLYMEQRLWKDNVIILGLKNHYTKFDYIAWPAFSTFNRFYNIPEISIGLIL
ncbi:MAG: hypothetical protein HOP08_05035 [Cyclobacteriaceae bacterium]|nr:hypothetical protein [Cyclobacteriaceae bacterium]